MLISRNRVSLTNILCILNLYVNKVTADYCEFGTCNEDQYCCGENKCCQKTVEVWYFWAKVFLLMVITVFIILYILLRVKHLWKYNSYKKLSVEEMTTPVS